MPLDLGRPDPDQAYQDLLRASLFKDLPPEMLREAATQMRQVRVPKGELIVSQGRRLQQALYVVVSGRARELEAVEAGGDSRILRYFGPGDVLGEIPMLTGSAALASVEAVLDTTLLALPHRAYHRILAHYSEASLLLARSLSRRLETWSQRRGRRRTTALIGIDAPGFAGTLLGLGVCGSLVEWTSSQVLFLDLAYQGPLPRSPGPGVWRSFAELEAHPGRICPERLRERISRAEDSLLFLVTDPESLHLKEAPPEMAAVLLGEAKLQASYVVVRLPPQPSPFQEALKSQLELVLRAREPGEEAPESGNPLSPHLWMGTVEPLESLRGAGPLPPRRLDRSKGARTLARVLDQPDFRFRYPREDRIRLECSSPFPRDLSIRSGGPRRETGRLVRHMTGRRVGLCLGSGTALGWAHIGVLEILLQEGLPIDAISGSSMGSAIAAMYATGQGVDQMLEIAASVDSEKVHGWADYNWPWMRDGLLRGDRVLAYLRELFGDTRIEDLPIPLVIQATDLTNGRPHFFREGPVAEAVRASVSLPGIFRPVPFEDKVLVDSGVHSTLPIEPLRALGADLVVAVNTTQSPDFNPIPRENIEGYNLFEIFLRSLEVMQTRRTDFESQTADLVIRPAMVGVDWKELWRSAEMIEFGRDAARKALGEISRLLRRPPP